LIHHDTCVHESRLQIGYLIGIHVVLPLRAVIGEIGSIVLIAVLRIGGLLEPRSINELSSSLSDAVDNAYGQTEENRANYDNVGYYKDE
jgi:hypothetical protein